MGTIQAYDYDLPTLPEQALLIEQAVGVNGVAVRPLTARGFDLRPVPVGVMEWLTHRLAETWYNGRLYYEQEWSTPGQWLADGGILHESWVQPDGSLQVTPRVLSWVNAYDPAYRSLLEEMREIHEEWSGIPLEPSIAYGPRIYNAGAVLARHVDKPATHVVGCSITIEAATERPWPFVIEDHQSTAYAIDIRPGEMLLFESSRLPHCRPEPLRGSHYINFYLHYRPRQPG